MRNGEEEENKQRTSILARKLEVGDSLFAECHVPADLNVLLSLALFQILVVVCLQLHQRPKYVLVSVGILVAAEEGNSGTGLLHQVNHKC